MKAVLAAIATVEIERNSETVVGETRCTEIPVIIDGEKWMRTECENGFRMRKYRQPEKGDVTLPEGMDQEHEGDKMNHYPFFSYPVVDDSAAESKMKKREQKRRQQAQIKAEQQNMRLRKQKQANSKKAKGDNI